jgi:hypothetical protein
MLTRSILAIIIVLGLGTGGAFAASHLAASGGTAVCVNDSNGLMRASATCRDGEHALTIGGGGGNVQGTQNGTFTVAEGATSAGKALPLTGASVSARCQAVPAPLPGVPDGIVGFLVIQAATGKTMDVPSQSAGSPQSSATFGGFGVPGGAPTGGGGSMATLILTSNGATATITVGGFGDLASKTCTFLWQAVESPN